MASQSVTTIPVDLKPLLEKLEFLGQIEEDQKINLSNMSLVSSESWFSSIIRLFRGDNRQEARKYIEETIDEAIKAIDNYRNSVFLKNLINALNKGRVGIKALSYTYRNDPDIVARFSVICQNIDFQLDRYRSLIIGREENKTVVVADNNTENNSNDERKTRHATRRQDLKVGQ